MRKKLSIILAGLLGASILFAGCSSKPEVTVSVQSVAMLTGYSSLGQFDRFAGIVESGDSIEVEKSETLEVKDIFVKVGDPVNPGDVLFSYNTETISLELEKMQLELEQLKNQVTTKKTQIKDLEAEKKKAPTDEQLGYTLQIQTLQLDVKETEYTITAKEKEISRTTSILGDSSVVATVSGTVASINTEGLTDDWGNMKPFMTINQSGDYRVKGTINEQNIRALPEQTPVIIRSRVSDQTWTGVVSKIDMEHPVTGNNDMFYYGETNEMTSSTNYPFYIQLETDNDLMLGQHVFIEPNLGQTEQEGIPLPKSFLVSDGDDVFVWAAGKDDQLEKRSVMLGQYDENLDTYQIIEGLKPSDYIAMPSDECQEGAAVNYYDEDSFQTDDDMVGDVGFDGENFNEDEYYEEADEYGEEDHYEEEYYEDDFVEGVFEIPNEETGAGR